MNTTYVFKFFFIDEAIEPCIVETETMQKVGEIFYFREDKYIIVYCNQHKREAVLRILK